jgi:membrane-associated phospholipid phosphatase
MNASEYLVKIIIYMPILLFFISAFLLRNKMKYLTYFVGGFIVNNGLNSILKLIIQEPRPSNDQRALEIGIANGHRVSFDKFGMPSGHAQTCGFALVFMSLVFDSPKMTAFYLVVSFITMTQRYIYNNHTILQLIVGFVTGGMFGYLTYIIANKQMMGCLKMKPDDNCFI